MKLVFLICQIVCFVLSMKSHFDGNETMDFIWTIGFILFMFLVLITKN